MFLASLRDIIRVPFGWLLNVLYNFTTNYGLALIIFAILVKVILLPATAKSKRSSMKMSRLAPKMQEIQKKYANDPQKQNAAIQALYKEEGVSMGGGCLWSLIPLLVLIPLYEVIRHPIVYMLQESTEVAAVIVETVKAQLPELFGANSYYTEVIAAPHIAELAEEIKAAIAEAGLTIKDSTMAGINFTFLGVDLGQDPVFNIFGSQWSWDWNHIGGFLIRRLPRLPVRSVPHPHCGRSLAVACLVGLPEDEQLRGHQRKRYAGQGNCRQIPGRPDQQNHDVHHASDVPVDRLHRSRGPEPLLVHSGYCVRGSGCLPDQKVPHDL